MKVYGGIAVLFGALAPFFSTFMAYHLRCIIDKKVFRTGDVGIDYKLYQGVFMTIIYLVYIGMYGFSMKEFLEG